MKHIKFRAWIKTTTEIIFNKPKNIKDYVEVEVALVRQSKRKKK
jgi:hypothetical protein